jgi:hypothetical protein
MTVENVLTEEEVYSLIVTGDISRSAALHVIRAYGSRKAMDTLQQARQSLPIESMDDAEIELRFNSCLQMLENLTQSLVAAMRKGAQ